jgi:hypothetical protein
LYDEIIIVTIAKKEISTRFQYFQVIDLINDNIKIGYENILIYQHKLHGMIALCISNKFQEIIFAKGSQKYHTYNEPNSIKPEITTTKNNKYLLIKSK